MTLLLEYKIVNLIIQSRVIEKRCIDCGDQLYTVTGYCQKADCGKADNLTEYTQEEWDQAFKDSENKLKNRRNNKQ